MGRLLYRGFWTVMLLVSVIALPALAVARDAPALVVPATTTTLHITSGLPEQFNSEKSSGGWQLVEQGDSGEVVPVDVEPSVRPDGTPDENHLQLSAMIPPRDGAAEPRRFLLQQVPQSFPGPPPAFQLKEISPASLELREGNRPVLVYNHGLITSEAVPKKDVRRTRGCYVHPLYGLSGEVLTDDFPRDHFHHHGLFWAWPHVKINGREYDLWLGKGIRQRFVRWFCRRVGGQHATIGVENGWFIGKRKVMIERVWLSAYKATDTARVVDVSVTLIPVDHPITLWGAADKSYGGMTLRLAVGRSRKATITVPDGKTKEDLSVKRLAWADLTCAFGEAAKPSGATLMISKSHPDYPPTWLTRHYGPLCVGYPGVEPKTFEPGKPLRMSYRLWIHNRAVDLDRLKEAYDAYLAGEDVRWE